METSNDFRKRTIKILKDLKYEKENISSKRLPIYDQTKLIAYLRVASVRSLSNVKEIKNLAAWRRKHTQWFFSQFTVTVKGTKKWLEEQVLCKEDRLLFIVETVSGVPFGHMGVYRFEFSQKTCEIDNVVRGKKHPQGVMTPALETLIAWALVTFKLKTLYLRVFSDNKKAIALYKRCGFVSVKKIPAKKIKEGNTVVWVEQKQNDSIKSAQRYFLLMKLRNEK